ncbi:peroxiredoxin [Nakamurella sp. UYEF19]|uniref:TlpA family protein disulfide reductase n=1 Tax=Nakamurella sp. UYEF19 TaxID=1756392 RepID=UPI0033950AB5
MPLTTPDVLHSARYSEHCAGRKRRLPGLPGLRRVLLLMVVAVLALAGCSTGKDATVYGGSFTFTSPGGKTEFSYPANERQEIGAMSGPDLAGTKTISVADYKGKVVVLNFWGSWCSPCRDEAAGLESSWQKFQSKGVQFLGVDVKDSASGAQAFVAGKQITYPSIFDPGMQTMLSVRGLPTGALPVTLVLDKKGRVAHIWLHEINEGDLNTVVTPLTAES